jgi:hypothetical protein
MPLTHVPAYTLLAIDGIDFSDYAVRGITLTLEPIDQAKNLARDCRGVLADISVSQFRMYKVSITCTDHEAPELTGIWPGQNITITCIPGIGTGNDSADQLTILAKVTTWQTSRDEWASEVQWQLEAEQRSFT